MSKYIILSVSDSNKHFQTAIDEYTKRLRKSVDLIDLKPHKHGNRDQIITKETKQIADKIQSYKKKSYCIVLLAKEGTGYTTEEIHQRYIHRPTVFVIGGPYGVDESLLTDLVDDYISLGSHTMPHGLAKLAIIEQIYRSTMIAQHRSYHY